MPDYTYQARTATGETAQGVVQAATRQEALRHLTQQALFPIDVRVDATARNWRHWLPARVSTDATADLLTQLSDLLANGVSLLDALKILSQQSHSPGLRTVLAQVRDDVANGQNLDEAMARHERVFSKLTVSMVRAGMEGGFLEESLTRVAGFLRKQAALKAKVAGAMTYPMVLAGIGFCFMIALVMFIVPMFEVYFEKLTKSGVGLPLITRILIGTSDMLVKYGVIMFGAAVAAGYGFRQLIATRRGRNLFDRYKLRVPLAGRIFHETSISRFCRVLGTLLRNGVPILKSLDIAGNSVGNVVLQKAISDSAENVSSGNRLADPLERSGFVSAPVLAMIRVAEESNTLDDVLVRISDRMDQKIERRLDSMVRLIEPLMLLVIGGIVLSIIIGVLLPIFDLTSTID